jgi:hypothetical protein
VKQSEKVEKLVSGLKQKASDWKGAAELLKKLGRVDMDCSAMALEECSGDVELLLWKFENEK